MTTTTFADGARVETVIRPPHPAAFSGTVVNSGTASDGTHMTRVRDADNVTRIYTTKSLRLAEAV
jgi:hypothetical protein